MTNDELVVGFEDGTLAPSAFRHREHVQLTWIYLRRYGRRETERRMHRGLRAFAARAGKPEKFDGPMTSAWVAAIAEAASAQPAPHNFDDLVRARPDLLDAASVRIPR